MSPPSPTLYAQLRSAPVRAEAVHEGRDLPAEELLQAIWQHQRLHRNRLKTVGGQPLFILHPGFLNREAGPDFRHAMVRIGDGAPRTGDIEVDPRPEDWLQHKHRSNPAYANVVLQVVWRSTNPQHCPTGLPTLELAPVLDSPLTELSDWLRQEPAPQLPPFVPGKCAAPLRDLNARQLTSLLEQAAVFRLQGRADQLRARARESGWDQALWEGVFRALGYKHNAWPMLRLAELLPRWRKPHSTRTEVLARLLGLSGLLPSDSGTTMNASARHMRQLWDCWWRERDELADCALPPRAWRLAGVRPANHPQRRLALAAHWITSGDLGDKVQTWCNSSHGDSRLPGSLLDLLRPTPDPFWSRQYTLRSRATAKPIPLVGVDRISDLAVDVILPWLWAKASQGRRRNVCFEVERRYLAWPSGSDNAVSKLARRRLLGSRRANLPARRSVRQGLLQIVRDYCDHSNSLCEQCRFPPLTHRFKEL